VVQTYSTLYCCQVHLSNLRYRSSSSGKIIDSDGDDSIVGCVIANSNFAFVYGSENIRSVIFKPSLNFPLNI